MEDSEAWLRLSAPEERLRKRDDQFAALRQAPESAAAALTGAIVRPARIEGQFRHALSQPVLLSKAVAIPSVPEPVQTTAPSAKAAAPGRNLIPPFGSPLFSAFPGFSPNSARKGSRFCVGADATVSGGRLTRSRRRTRKDSDSH
jgi:hypothetical protein